MNTRDNADASPARRHLSRSAHPDSSNETLRLVIRPTNTRRDPQLVVAAVDQLFQLTVGT